MESCIMKNINAVKIILSNQMTNINAKSVSL